MLKKVQNNFKKFNNKDNSRCSSPQPSLNSVFSYSDHPPLTSADSMEGDQTKSLNVSPTNSKENLSMISGNDEICKDENSTADMDPGLSVPIITNVMDVELPSAGSIFLSDQSIDGMDGSVVDAKENYKTGGVSRQFGRKFGDEPQISPTSASASHASISGVDAVDGFFNSSAAPNDTVKTKATIEQLNAKILRINEQIQIEQKSQDEYVSEYLRLTKSADRAQMNRIKGVFERKNQKSMANIAQLRRKREQYHTRIKDLQTNGGSTKDGKAGRSALRDVGANLRGISGGVVGNIKQATQNAAEALVNKPKDIAQRLKTRFGSSDNLENLKDMDTEEGRYVSGDEVSSNSEYETNSLHKNSIPGVTITAPPTTSNSQSSIQPEFYLAEQNRVNNQLNTIITQLFDLKNGVAELRQNQNRTTEKVQTFQKSMTEDFGDLLNNLRTERFRGERLETQVSNLIGFQDSGLNSLKEEINSIQAKFDYHLQERTREMQEAVGNCQARLQEMERQQRRLRNNSTDNAFDDASGRFIGKLFNLLMGLLAVVLVLSTTVISFTKQLTQSKARFVITCVVAVVAILLARYWHHIQSHFYDSPTSST